MRRRTLFACALVIAAGIVACADTARLPVSAGIGPHPALPAPHQSLIPTIKVAPATGWPSGVTPKAAVGMRVNAFASGLDHPRFIYVLPNGDVLVSETNAPPKPDDQTGVRGKLFAYFQKKAGAGVPSAIASPCSVMPMATVWQKYAPSSSTTCTHRSASRSWATGGEASRCRTRSRAAPPSPRGRT